MSLFDKIAEARIREAIQNGELDEVPLAGQPLDLREPPGVPEDLKASYRILKNAGVLPEEVELKRDICRLEDLIADCEDQDLRAAFRRDLSDKLLRFDLIMERRGATRVFRAYRVKLARRCRP